jgi:hypothetical protein
MFQIRTATDRAVGAETSTPKHRRADVSEPDYPVLREWLKNLKASHVRSVDHLAKDAEAVLEEVERLRALGHVEPRPEAPSILTDFGHECLGNAPDGVRLVLDAAIRRDWEGLIDTLARCPAWAKFTGPIPGRRENSFLCLVHSDRVMANIPFEIKGLHSARMNELAIVDLIRELRWRATLK